MLSPAEGQFREAWRKERENLCYATAQEIVRTTDDLWPTTAYYVGQIANGHEDFVFVSERLANWVKHFSETKAPPAGRIAKEASVDANVSTSV